MMIDILQYGFAILILIIMLMAVWESTKMISEKKERRRKGLTDYYDNPIKGDKDER